MADASARIEALSEESQQRAKEGETKRISAAFFLFETPRQLPAEDATKRRDAAGRRRAQQSRA